LESKRKLEIRLKTPFGFVFSGFLFLFWKKETKGKKRGKLEDPKPRPETKGNEKGKKETKKHPSQSGISSAFNLSSILFYFILFYFILFYFILESEGTKEKAFPFLKPKGRKAQ